MRSAATRPRKVPPMTPWLTMPAPVEGRRLAAANDAYAALSAVRCALRLLEATAAVGRERELLAAIERAVTYAEGATRRLAGSAP